MRIRIVIDRSDATRYGELEEVDITGLFNSRNEAHNMLDRAIEAIWGPKVVNNPDTQGEAK